jgi:uncharacterized membrane protein
MREIIELIIITFLPFLELRASIPYGILKLGMHWWNVFVICVVTNIVLGVLIFLFIEWIIMLVTMIKPVRKIWHKYVERIQHKIHKAVEKYGEWAVAVFIGIPLPGSGVYSGALAAYLIGLDFKKFLIANIIGVLIAGIIVTVVSITGAGALSVFVKMV